MSNVQSKTSHRLLAALLSIAMVFSMLPFTMVAHAATTEHPDAVTITVVDEENGQAVKDASVAITVDSVSNGDAYISETKETDDYGVVEVMASSDFVAGDFIISAIVTAKGYAEGTLSKTAISTGEDNFEVSLVSTTIKDVTIVGKKLTYTGQEQEIVDGTEVRGDTVTYAVDDGERTTTRPKRKDAGTYKIKVVVSRAGKTDLEETVTTTISPKVIDIGIEPNYGLKYNETDQELVTLTGTDSFAEGDTVTWTVDGKDIESKDVPKGRAVGTYTIVLTVDRGTNYEKLVTDPVTVEITKGDLDLEGLVVKGLEGEYTVDEDGLPVAQPAVTVKANPHNYDLEYQLDDGDLTVNESDWVDEPPLVTDAGSYIVWVKAVKDGYYDSDVGVTSAESAEVPYNVYVAKADQTFDFDEYDAMTDDSNPEGVELDYSDSDKKSFDFSATDEKALAGGTITYYVEAEDGVATIEANGCLTVYFPGKVIVTATLSGNNNYNECVIKYYLNVTAVNGQFISFEDAAKDFVLGTDDTIADQEASLNDKVNGGITYSIDGDGVRGVDINTDTGELTVTDIDVLAEEMHNNGGSLEIIVTAEKEATEWWGGAKASYEITVTFGERPAEAYTIPEPDGANNWFKTEGGVVVAAPDGYTIAMNASGNFGESVTFEDQGINERHVYLKNTEDNAITDRIAVVDASGENLKIDNIAPDANTMDIEIQELSIVEKIGRAFGFFNPSVTIEFIVEDETDFDESGLEYIEWFYTKDENATSSILAEKSERLAVTKVDNKYVATLTVTATEAEQYRGHIGFKACDVAGNESCEVKEDGVVIVVDTIHPRMMSADFKLAESTGVYTSVNRSGVVHHYYNDDVVFTFTVKEANFFSEDVDIDVSKDGSEHDVNVEWSDDENNEEIHYGKFILDGDGDYVVTMRYRDQSTNVIVDDADDSEIITYTSEVITIDTIKPVVEIEYVRDDQKTIFTVVEHNFLNEHVAIDEESTMKDINGNDISFTAAQLNRILQTADWTQTDTDTYKYEYDQYVNGIYSLILDYTDYSKWEADPYKAEFIIDRGVPTEPIIEYAEPETTALDTFLEVITLGFYGKEQNPVTVRFTAYDTSAGVKSFTWDYTKQDGASTINHPEERPGEEIPAVQADDTDKSKFTAEITLTANEAAQYRGYLSVMATDVFKNNSVKKVDDGNIIVVDTIAPEMTVEYTVADRTIVNNYYYNNDVEVKFTVTEANFYAEDVEVTVTKNGEEFDYGTVTWGTRDAEDKTIGFFTLKALADHSGDGDYVITVVYTDRSSNEMNKYVSDTLTIDTTLPVIKVDYQNKTVANTLTDRDGNEREYFADTQTAVITIDEHNFISNEVELTIIAEDVTGAELDAAKLNSKTEWFVDSIGDTNIITITYPGDANYTFDIAYTDKAANVAEDYATDYFTVDKTDPTNLTVDYSTSVLDTVLEAVTFGFYNAKMTVTLTAEDPTSEVRSFLYSYLNADGVNSVSAELINEAINAADIKYSEDRKTATVTFVIPKMVLGNDNQFNGTVEFTATDRAGNETDTHKETKRIVVDNIAPTAQISYNEATNVVGDISYYNDNINATVTINEANFYADDVQVMVSKDGGAATAVTPTWTNNSVDVHVGTFTLTEDGDYIVTINYTDKSSNQMTTYTSNQMTIDTKIEAPTYTINGVAKTEVGGAYKGDATIGFSFADQNFDDTTIKLTRTRFDKVDEDVTETFIEVSDNNKGGSGSFTIPSEVGNDGIYVLTINMTDKAKHAIESEVKFTINRFGSVYEYSNELVDLIKDGGQYITSVEDDLVITEYNADRILEGSLKILITRDRENIDVGFTSNPENINAQADIGESGWYQYVYTIKASNFKEDGVYKISLMSQYATDDSEKNESTSVPENSIDEQGNKILDTMNFTVDSVAPEIRNIVNLDKAIVNAQTLDVRYTIVDVGGLKSIEVTLNGETETITEFGDSAFNYSGEFTINESSDAQTVQIKVTDLAGNVTDTAAENFGTGGLYIFNDKVTVSTNFFVRWYANTVLFWGSIGGVVVLVAAIWFFIAFKRKKKEENK